MKISVKQACEIEGVNLGPNIHKKPGTFNVPGSFVLIPFFCALVADEKIKVLEMSKADFEEIEKEAEAKKIDESHLHPAILPIIQKFSIELSKEGEDEESDSSDSESDAADGSEASEAGKGEADSEQEKLPSSENVDEVKHEEASEALKSEFAVLHEKAKRLNKTEKKRYDELKSVLKIEE